jgi:hypothetical protein
MLARPSPPPPIDLPFIIDEFMFAKKRNRCVTMRTDHCAASHGSHRRTALILRASEGGTS